MWELQPFSGAVRLDRDLLRFQYEEHYGDVRVIFRQYVLDTISPTKVLELVTGLLALRTRPATDVVHARGVRDMSFFLGHFGGTTLPATPEDVLGYAGYVVELREFRLDSWWRSAEHVGGGYHLCNPYRMAMATDLPAGDTDSDDVVSSCDCAECRAEMDYWGSCSSSDFDDGYF
eukprot:gene2905-3716_t